MLNDVMVDGSPVTLDANNSYTFTNVVADHQIFVWFTRGFTLNVTATNGFVTKDPDKAIYEWGDVVTLTAVPETGYHFTNWSGFISGTTNPATITFNGDYDKSVTANFAINTFTITASAGTGGSISPSGSVSVFPGDNQKFTVTINPGYSLNQVLVDGSPVTLAVDNSYTFTNVTTNHTITASFTQINFYTLTVTASTHGTVTKYPDKPTYGSGEEVWLTATPEAGYHFTNWGGDASGTANQVAITMNRNKSVTADFAINTYIIDAPGAGIGRTISPSGDIPVNHGGSQKFTVTFDPGYVFFWATVDGQHVTLDADNSYTFTNVTANHNFIVMPTWSFNLAISATNGTVTKNPDNAFYILNDVVTLTAIPNAGYHFTNWGGDLSGTTNPATITINGNKSVTANFAINTYTITAGAGTDGTISPSGSVSVNSGDSQKFTVTANPEYSLNQVLVDGAAVTLAADSSYTFTNVTANHTITASFTNTSLGTLISPTEGTEIGSSETFTWSAGTDVINYQLYLGTAIGKYDLTLINTTSTSTTVNNLPLLGQTIYAQLWTQLTNGTWVSEVPKSYLSTGNRRPTAITNQSVTMKERPPTSP